MALHLDVTATGLPGGTADLVLIDPHHLADPSPNSIMGRRLVAVRATSGLARLAMVGVAEALFIAHVGILVKLADTSHGSEVLQLSRWAVDRLGAEPCFVAHTYRPPLGDGTWKGQRVLRHNGAVWLGFRKHGGRHQDSVALCARQTVSRLPNLEEPRGCRDV